MPLPSDPPLDGRIALVAGATRGAGRGIALALAEAGATVIGTGRSSRSAGTTHSDRPETIEETADLIQQAGGRALARRVDHTREDQVRALFEEIRENHGRLDILVNDIWGGDSLTEWGKTFWQVDPQPGFQMMERALHTHILTSRYGVPLMLAGMGTDPAHHGLIVEVTDGAFQGYRGQLFYDLCKASTMRLAYAMSVELEQHPVTAVAVTPGFLRSEAVLDHFGVREDNWRDAIAKDPHFEHSETPRLVGRAIAALAADPTLPRYSGQTLTCWDLARHYDLHDVDGRQPHWDDHLDQAIEAILTADDPSEDDLMLLRIRRPQIDFDTDRRDQHARITAFLEVHRK